MESFKFLAVMLSWILSGMLVACAGSVVLTQTHPAAPYVCRTGNITLRCQYDTADGVSWSVGDMANVDLSTIPGHTALPNTTTYQEVVVDSYTNLRERYQCSVVVGSLISNSNNFMPPQIEAAEVTISNLTLASRTATTLNVTWSAGYPKCYSFAVSYSTQDGSINVTQPANRDTSHTLTSLQPGTTYRIEVEAVRKGDGADGQRAKVMGNFTTYDEVTAAPVPSRAIISTSTSTSLPPKPTAAAETTDNVPLGPIIGGVIGGLAFLIAALLAAALVLLLVYKRKAVPSMRASTPKVPRPSQDNAAKGSEDGKQTYAMLDWQNSEQRPAKAPDNEWFTVQYSEVRFDGNK